MNLFGVAEAEPLVAQLGGARSEAEARELFARAAWSAIVEPGDRVAGIAIRSLGAPRALQALIDQSGPDEWAALLASEEVSAEAATHALDRWKPRVDSRTMVRVLTQAQRVGARLLGPESPSWPHGLNDLGDHAPVALWVRGSDAALAATERSIALVGARAATGYGEHVAMDASAGLVDRNFAVVSGAAYGIDGMAHRAALASNGTTVAFLAGGVDRFYPSGHDALLSRIAELGAVVAELPCGSAPTRWRFLQRNRLIAAASSATVVLEAGQRSGSLNTAHHALQVGRPLGVVPGPVTSAASAGCHRLLRETTAVCVTTPDEMAALADPLEENSTATASGGNDAGVVRLLDALSERSPHPVSELAARTGLAIAEVQSLLGRLELEQSVAERERGWVRRPSNPRTKR